MVNETQIVNAGGALDLRVKRLTRRYWRGGRWHRRSPAIAACDVSFHIPAGKTLGLVGSSGSGKSTVARCVMGLEKPDDGEIWLGDRNIAELGASALASFRAKIQMVFQDPVTSMNPHMSAAEIIEEPLLIQHIGTNSERRDRARQLMKEVRLPPEWMGKRASEFSGGQKQRLAIARALALRPRVLVLDEALTGLDLSTQAQIANLLLELQGANSLTYLFISHDLNLVARVADSIAVMAAGRIVEQGFTAQMISQPRCKETQELLSAAKEFRSMRALAQGAAR
jgi:peptide/nickel transport system ATP-binding protein